MILGVSFDTIAQNAKFAEKNDFPYQLLSDLERTMGVAYGAAKSTDARGAARVGVIVGPDGKIVEWSGRVSPREYPEHALGVVAG